MNVIFFTAILLLFPSFAWARYGSSSDAGWIIFLFIVAIIGLLFLYSAISSHEEKKMKQRYELLLDSEKRKIEYKLETKNLEKIKKLEKREKELEYKKNQLEENKILQEKLFEEKTKGFPWVADIYGQFAAKQFEPFEQYFLTKKNPAYKSAEIVRDLKTKIKESEKKAFIYKGIIDYYTALFP